MKTCIAVAACVLFGIFASTAFSQNYIIVGIPTSLNLIEGKEGNLAARLAVDEINAKGGVKVGNEKRPFKVESIDIRDGEPGVPVSEALLGIEKLILDKKAYATVVGNFRSEALLAAMDIYSKYKVHQYRNHRHGAQIRGPRGDGKGEIQVLIQDVPRLEVPRGRRSRG